MDEEKNNNSAKGIVKGVMKKGSKKILIVILIAALILGLIPAIYVKFGDDFKEISKKNSTYTTKVNEKGQVIYVKNEEDGEESEEENIVTTEDMAEDFKEVLGQYIDADDEEYTKKIKYIIEAETVTKLPYIEPSETEEPAEGEEEPLVGQIKFYRYSNEEESNAAYIKEDDDEEILDDKYRLKYVAPDEFKALEENYKAEGNEEVFNYFTMDTEGNVVIAYGKEERRTITTEGDTDLTLEIVREQSGEEAYTGNSQEGFSMIRYTIEEKKIDYLSYVEKYVMPSNLLYALLVQTKDIDFVEAIAELAYKNVIAIGIYDNESESNVDELYTYNKVLELSVNTQLDFRNVNTTSPKISASRIREYYIPFRCMAMLQRGSFKHRRFFYTVDVAEETDASRNLYVGGTNSDGKIVELVSANNAQNFKTYVNIHIKAKSTPTVGIMLADTWIAKWKATYKIDTKATPSGTEEPESQPDSEVAKYNSKQEFIEAFGGNMESSVKNELNSHATELKNKAIEDIVKNIESSMGFKDENQEIDAESLDTQTKKIILQSHINNCESCSQIISKAMPNGTIDQIYASVTVSVGKLNKTSVYTDYMNSLQYYIQTQNANITQRRKETFRTELQNQIICEQTIEGTKQNVNIYFSNSKLTTTSIYKKEETDDINDGISKDGEKFAEVFNNPKFYESRQAVLQRIEWFWEYIRANKDTERLENVLRYLLNIATGTENFIKDFDFQTMFEDLFKDKFNTLEGVSGELSVLRQLVDYFEGSTPIVTKDGIDYYVAVADSLTSNGLPTIGHGVTTYADYLFPVEYQGWGAGSEIPVSVVDAVKEEILKNFLNSAKAAFPEATSYQAIAIASVGYNCGEGFYQKVQESGNFNKYIEEKEDKYGETVDVEVVREYVGQLEGSGNAVAIKQQLIQEINCTLYTENWSQWVDTSKYDNVPGLIKRRYIEWLMFQYGYMYPTNCYWTGEAGNDIQQKIVEIAQNSSAYGIIPQKGYCLGWVYDVYEAAGAGRGNKNCAFCAGYSYGVSKDFSNIPLGACVYGTGTGSEGAMYGHVGIYIGDGKVADNIGYVRITTLDAWRAENPDGCWGWSCSTPVNSAYPITEGLIHKGYGSGC